MNRWRVFLGVSLFGAFALISQGVPAAPVAAGIGLSALLTYWQQRRQSHMGKG